ncbi:MAG: TIGR00341 family protein [Chitinophagales bacterium]|nr:TIGR00341 family protein [Chitinophagales bacterium]
MNRIFGNFRLNNKKENHQTVIDSIEKGVVFKGTNLWILVFAIFIASLGLNVNSTAVIIGAMLISPLMGPIMGLGLGMGINDLVLLRKSISNYLLAAIVGLTTSTIFFLISPISDAHSEILARTSPNIYDVLIAFFGGLAGIIATSSKQKGNVIPGVAIATALMPPLCTAGYGLATLQFYFFFGAFYLFLINTVFIALATLVTVRLLKFPFHLLPDAGSEARAKLVVWAVVIVTLLPSLYFGYDIVKQNKFTKNANRFVDLESAIPNDYLLKRTIDPKKKSIVLVYGGAEIDSTKISELRTGLKNYNLESATLEIKQGFAYLNDNVENEQVKQLNNLLAQKDKEIQTVKSKLDSINGIIQLRKQIIKEANALYPEMTNLSFSLLHSTETSNGSDTSYIAYLQFNKIPSAKEKTQIQNWMETKLNKNVRVIIDK